MKGSVLKKFLCTCLVTATAFAATTISASACTTIYVGGPILDVRGEEKAKLTTVDLLKFFEKAGDGVSDKMLLAS